MSSRPLNIFVPHCSSLLTDHRPHGDGLVAYGFLRQLGEHGHRVWVAAESVDIQRPLPPNVVVAELGTKGGLVGRLRYMQAMRALYRSVRKTVRFDVIHQLNPVFTGMSLALPRTSAPLILGPYVSSWPDDPDATTSSVASLRGLALRARSVVAQLQQSKADALLLTTPAARSRIPDAERLEQKLHLLPHGLDVHFFSPVSGDGKPSDANQDILFLSNLVERKGVFDLILAFDEVASRLPSARLLIGGDGPELDRARSLAEASRAPARILFLGRQTREDSLTLLRQCALFCQPSHGEPYGMSAAEAMGCARPLVVTNTGGLAYLADREGGLQVPVKNSPELARALTQLLLDPDRRRSMGEHNRAKAVKTMSWESVIEQLERIYYSAMSERSPAGRTSSPAQA